MNHKDEPNEIDELLLKIAAEKDIKSVARTSHVDGNTIQKSQRSETVL